MKQKLLFTALSVLCAVSMNAQSLSESLLDRYESLPPNGNSPFHYFSGEEQQLIRSYLRIQNLPGNSSFSGSEIIHGTRNSAGEFGNFAISDISVFNTIAPSLPTSDFESSGDIDPNNLTMGYVTTLEDGEFYSIDINTGIYTSMGTIAPPPGQEWNGLEFDPTTGVLYAISSDFDSVSSLSTIDVGSMSYSLIGDTGAPGAIAIAITDSGQMYGYDVIGDSFFSINKATGQGTFIGQIGFDANFGQDLEWDSSTGTMYMVAYNAGIFEAELRTVDLNTGVTTLIGDLIPSEVGTQMAWAAIQNPPVLSVSDKEAIRLSIVPNPAQDRITVNTKERIESISLFNSLGQVALDHRSLDATTLDVSHLPSGMYLVVVVTDGGRRIQKLILN